MTAPRLSVSWRTFIVVLGALVLSATACGAGDPAPGASIPNPDTAPADTGAVLRVGAIPDQEPQRLQRTYGLLADHLAAELGVGVVYVPVTDYQSAVTGFRVGDLDLVWFGGLTGVQARAEVEGAHAVAQRDIDRAFTSVFVTRADSGIDPVSDVSGLAELAGHTFTF
ncbi:MAG: putative selenate ABC transporter substrate-binding protein, partial [Actinomyces sp.]